MNDNPNALWENCDYLLWPAWYAYVSWAVVASGFLFGAYCAFVLDL